MRITLSASLWGRAPSLDRRSPQRLQRPGRHPTPRTPRPHQPWTRQSRTLPRPCC